MAELSPKLKLLGDGIIAGIKAYVSRATDPILENQRGLISRLDKLQQQQSAFEKRLAGIERKQQ